jgi:hypothetical protein
VSGAEMSTAKISCGSWIEKAKIEPLGNQYCPDNLCQREKGLLLLLFIYFSQIMKRIDFIDFLWILKI